jgi:hypothetical protein
LRLNELYQLIFDLRDPKIQPNPMLPKNKDRNPYFQSQDFILHTFENAGSMYITYQKEVTLMLSQLTMSALFQQVDYQNCIKWYWEHDTIYWKHVN